MQNSAFEEESTKVSCINVDEHKMSELEFFNSHKNSWNGLA
jgi:hypothetical protein